MLQGIDLEQIKQYNKTLKQYRDKASAINAEIDYTNKALASLCSELTAELGVTVTLDNVEQIYNEYVEKINSTLQSGQAVLAKIASEEQNSVSSQQTIQNQQVQQPVQQIQPVQQVQQMPYQSMTQMTQQQPVQVAQQQQIMPPPVQGALFNSAGTVGNAESVTLPTMFKLG